MAWVVSVVPLAVVLGVVETAVQGELFLLVLGFVELAFALLAGAVRSSHSAKRPPFGN